MKEEIDHILINILKGIASREEIIIFSEWIKDYKNEEYYAKFQEMWHVSQDMQLSQFNTNIEQQRQLARLMGHIRKSKQSYRIRKFTIWATSAAASFLLITTILKVAGIVGWGVNRDFATLAYSTDSVKMEIHEGKLIRNIKGKTGAITVIDPSDIKSAEAGITIHKESDADGISKKAKVYNSVTTPPGERVAMVLSDGTRVYLTSNSYLKYPSSFEDDKREVTLVGRAYFEVNKSKIPFVVNTSDMEIEVLGTSFDVESRTNHNNSNVILVEGSVKVNTEHESLIIKPNEQLSIQRSTNKSTITTVDSKLLTMWKDGVLIVRGQSFEELLENLSAWYGVKIIDRTTVPAGEKFNGRFDREDTEAAIKAVCISARIKYKIVNGHLVLEDI